MPYNHLYAAYFSWCTQYLIHHIVCVAGKVGLTWLNLAGEPEDRTSRDEIQMTSLTIVRKGEQLPFHLRL